MERKVGKEITNFRVFDQLMLSACASNLDENRIPESFKKFKEESEKNEWIKWRDDTTFKEFHELIWECGPGYGNKNGFPEIKNDPNQNPEIEIETDGLIMQSRDSLMCPLSKGLLVDPVKTINCNHSFSKSAIYGLMAQSQSEMVPCPVAGCGAIISKGALRCDERLERKLKRIGEIVFVK